MGRDQHAGRVVAPGVVGQTAMMRRTGLRRGQRLRRQSRRRRAIGPAYRAFSEQIRARDGWRCAFCRTKEAPLDIHHVVKRSQGGALLEPSNAVLLCRMCHAQTDVPFARGRLVVAWMPRAKLHVFQVVYAQDKAQARRAGLV